MTDPLALVRKHVHADTPKLPAKVRDEVVLLLMNEIGVTAGDVIVELCRRVEAGERPLPHPTAPEGAATPASNRREKPLRAE